VEWRRECVTPDWNKSQARHCSNNEYLYCKVRRTPLQVNHENKNLICLVLSLLSCNYLNQMIATPTATPTQTPPRLQLPPPPHTHSDTACTRLYPTPMYGFSLSPPFRLIHIPNRPELGVHKDVPKSDNSESKTSSTPSKRNVTRL
jgi:hypothetical protein